MAQKRIRITSSFVGRDKNKKKYICSVGEEMPEPPGVDWVAAGLAEYIEDESKAAKSKK